MGYTSLKQSITKLNDLTEKSYNSLDDKPLIYLQSEVNALLDLKANKNQIILNGAVDTYDDLPTNAENGNLYLVKNATGIFGINRRKKGLYYFDGSNWIYTSGDIASEYITETELNEALSQSAYTSLIEVEKQLQEESDGWYDIAGQFRLSNLTAIDIGGVQSSLTQIKDLSNANAPANKNTSVNAPLVSTELKAGKKYLEFFGDTDKRLMISNININTPDCELTAVLYFDITNSLRFQNGGGKAGLFGHDNGGWDRFLWIDETGYLGGGGALSNPWNSGDAKIPLNSWCVITACFYTGRSSEIWLNGVKIYEFEGKDYTNTQGSDTLVFGDINPDGLFTFSGKIAEFICYKKVNTDEFKSKIQNALKTKWEID